jgi:hypothetical protein
MKKNTKEKANKKGGRAWLNKKIVLRGFEN